MNNKLTLTKLASLLAIVCCASAEPLLALDPPPDGGYPNQTTAEGEDALFSLSSSSVEDTALGYHALYSAGLASYNTAVGANALGSNVNGFNGTAVGAEALADNDYSDNNTAVGYAALSHVSGPGDTDNVAVGYRAMALADSYSCVAIGSEALVRNHGQLNVAVGTESLSGNTTGAQNTAIGWRSLFNNDTGNNNTAEGVQAMFYNETGNNNTVEGVQAMLANTNGNKNVAVGVSALSTTRKGSNNIALGFGAGRKIRLHNNICIGNLGEHGDAGVTRIGTDGVQTATYIAGINGVTVAGGVGVVIDSNGQLGTVTSSAHYKENIKPMDKASEAILSLQPVTFHYKPQLDSDGIPQFGLVAEQVEKVNPDLVAHDDKGKPYTVRYEAVNAMLLNEFLKDHRRAEDQARINREQEATIGNQQKQIAALTAALTEQAAQIQKVSAQVAASQPPIRVVTNEK